MAISSKILVAAQDRKKALLAVCLCLFAISITYRLLNPFRQESLTRLTFPNSVSKVTESAQKGPAATAARDVWIDQYLNPPHHSGKVLSNVFYRKQASVQGGVDVPEGAGPQEAASTPESDKRLQVQEDLSHFRWFGSMHGQGDRVLFLERGKDILLVREGDSIDGKYLIKRITGSYLIIRAKSIGEDVRIELGPS